MNKFLGLLFLAVVVTAKSGDFPNNGKNADIQSGKLITWYTCTAQGNYPDPTTCDHYIACTTANLAYQMPCQMGHGGARLWYVRDSGPVEAESYCDYPEVVDCDIGNPSTEEPQTEKPTTEEPTEKPTEKPTEPPVTQRPTTTTAAPALPGHYNCTILGEVSNKTVAEGDSCTPMEDCKQCGTCGQYLTCEASSNTWQLMLCDEKVQPDGSIKLDDKLFWRPGSASDLGGLCSPWASLGEIVQGEYRADPTCKHICEVEGDATNIRKYWYTDPNLEAGTWKAERVPLCCDVGTQFDEDKRQCVLCRSGNDCTVQCP